MDDDKPIPGPAPSDPEYMFEPDPKRYLSSWMAKISALADLVRKPAYWIHDNIVEPNRGPKYYWYHQKFKRALPIDECYLDDLACIAEANIEFKRNRLVDTMTLDLLRHRRDYCNYYYVTTKGYPFKGGVSEKCDHLEEAFQRESTNFFIKYGEMEHFASVLHAFNKQKHVMVMERRKEALKKKIEQQKLASSGAEGSQE